MRVIVLTACWAVLFGGSVASGYQTYFPYFAGGEQLYLKWGDNHAGTPGGTVTWSIVPDGTPLDPSINDPDVSGTSQLNALIDALGRPEALAAIERAFDQWSSVANIYFQRVEDTGVPLASPQAVAPHAGQIRLGAWAIEPEDWLPGAYGIGPPPNYRTTFDGDVLVNSVNRFQLAAGAEGDLIDFYQPPTFFFHNDFEGLMLHEIGHTLGLDHSNQCSVMSVDFDCYKHVNRILDADDVAGIQFLYGPALSADFNLNNAVRGTDLAVWESGYGTTSGASQGVGDADRDGDVDGADLLLWQQQLGRGAPVLLPATTAAPEPTTALAALLASIMRGARARVELKNAR